MGIHKVDEKEVSSGDESDSDQKSGPENYICCAKKNWPEISQKFKELTDDQLVVQQLDGKGLLKWIQLAQIGFDETKLEEEMLKFKHSGFMDKITGAGLMGPAAIFIRNSICNVVNVTRQGEIMLNTIGTPLSIAESIKAGSFAGFVNVPVYFVTVIILLISSLF